MQIEHINNWVINDQHPDFPWCAVNKATGEVLTFNTWVEASAYIYQEEINGDENGGMNKEAAVLLAEYRKRL